MQNKNRTLNKVSNGFALIAAIFLMLFISILLLKMLRYSTEESSRVVNDYLQEQAMLLTYNATEYAVYLMLQDVRTTACTTQFNINYPSNGAPLFNINGRIRYIWANGQSNGFDVSCRNYIHDANASVANRLQYAASGGAAKVDVAVTTDPNIAGLSMPIRYFRRTLQKL